MKDEELFEAFRIAELIAKMKEGALSGQEYNTLERWAGISDGNRQFLESLQREDNMAKAPAGLDAFNAEKAFAKFSKKTERITASNSKIRLLKPMVIAASLILLLGFYLIWQFYFLPGREQQHITSDIQPATTVAVLTLSNGLKIRLDTLEAGRLLSDRGALISRSGDGVLQYDLGQQTDNHLRHTISVPAGGKFRVLLPDGTKVWLNAATTLTYGTSRNDGPIELSGEAYFDVPPNASKPLKVKANNTLVTVLGTSFNVTAYKTDEVISTLIDGRIRLNLESSAETKILRPGEYALTTNNSITVKDADISASTGWKDGLFIFHRAPLPEVMDQLERWYNIETDLSGVKVRDSFYGEINRDVPLSQVLQMLRFTSNLNFRLEGRRLIVSQ